MIWHASRKLINKCNPCKGSTKADKHGHVGVFHGCEWSRRKGWVLKRKRWLFLRPAVVGCLFSHATCLWLLMTTAALRSLIFPTHLHTLMIHLHGERSCPCSYASEPIILTYSSPNNHFLKRNFWQMRGPFSSSGFTEVKNSYLMYLNETFRLFFVFFQWFIVEFRFFFLHPWLLT